MDAPTKSVERNFFVDWLVFFIIIAVVTMIMEYLYAYLSNIPAHVSATRILVTAIVSGLIVDLVFPSLLRRRVDYQGR
jgi:multidrug resistance efflux pump